MKLNIVLLEARAHADRNLKHSVNSIISKYINLAAKAPHGLLDTFVSFTKLDKLGINPQSLYNTPYGIYAYPIDYVYEHMGDDNSAATLPFAGDQPYVNIFKVSSPNVINLDTLSAAKFDHYTKILHTLTTKYGVSSAALDSWITNSRRGATQDWNVVDQDYDAPESPSYGQRLWYITHKLSRGSAVKWNTIFRELGVVGCVDPGTNVIHGNEPTQAVFFYNREH